MNSIFFVKRIRIKLLFSEKFGILKITGGTPGLACAISAGKKMVLDQKPPLQREQVVGSSPNLKGSADPLGSVLLSLIFNILFNRCL